MTESLADWTHGLDGWGVGSSCWGAAECPLCWGLVAPWTQVARSSHVVARNAHLNVNILIFQVLATNLRVVFFFNVLPVKESTSGGTQPGGHGVKAPPNAQRAFLALSWRLGVVYTTGAPPSRV